MSRENVQGECPGRMSRENVQGECPGRMSARPSTPTRRQTTASDSYGGFAMDLHGLQVTWLGHGTFKLRTAAGKTLLLDPWVQDTPACPADQKQVGKLDTLLITHGHGDHIGNAI